jgi:hypothetical protein
MPANVAEGDQLGERLSLGATFMPPPAASFHRCCDALGKLVQLFMTVLRAIGIYRKMHRIPAKSRHEMEVDVKDFLARGSAVRLGKMIPLTSYSAVSKRRRHTVNEPKDMGCFVFAQVAKFSGVPARNNKNVAGIDLANVHQRDGMFIFGNHTGCQFAGKNSAEDARIGHAGFLV